MQTIPHHGPEDQPENQCGAAADQLGIGYELREYEVDPDDLSAERVAAKIGLPPEQVFSTLVARGGGGELLSGVDE